MCVCACVYFYTQLHIHVCIEVHIYTPTYMYVYIYTHVHLYTYTSESDILDVLSGFVSFSSSNGLATEASSVYPKASSQTPIRRFQQSHGPPQKSLLNAEQAPAVPNGHPNRAPLGPYVAPDMVSTNPSKVQVPLKSIIGHQCIYTKVPRLQIHNAY